MIDYISYLKLIAYANEDIYSEEDFNRLAAKFKNAEISLEDYNPFDEDLERYILDQLFEDKFGDKIWVSWVNDDEVEIDYYEIYDPSIIDEVKSLLESYDYTLCGYEELKEFVNKYGTGNQ